MKEAKEKLPNQINYPIEDWQYQVKNGDTKLNYGEWIEHCIERDEVSGNPMKLKSYTTNDLIKLLTEADPTGNKQIYMNDGDGNGDVPCGIVIDWQSDACLCISIADIKS